MHKITTKKKRINDEGRYLKGTGSTDVCHVLVAVWWKQVLIILDGGQIRQYKRNTQVFILQTVYLLLNG